MLGAPSMSKDLYGDQFDYEYDADLSLIKKLYYDGSSGGGTSADRTYEEYDRNGFKQVTRYRDRLGNVTLFEYDGNGNLLKRKVGLVESGGSDVPQPEYAEYVYIYDGNGLLLEVRQVINDTSVDEIAERSRALLELSGHEEFKTALGELTDASEVGRL